MLARLEPAAPRSRDKHSTTVSLCSLYSVLYALIRFQYKVNFERKTVFIITFINLYDDQGMANLKLTVSAEGGTFLNSRQLTYVQQGSCIFLPVELYQANVVARTLKKYAHQKKTTEPSSDVFNCVPFQN